MKLRIRFTKLGKVRWTSHRDVARIWERAFRKASLPVCYTAGFSPRPKISFGLALPTGAESIAEYLDVDVDVDAGGIAGSAADALDVVTLPNRLSAGLPTGIDASAAAEVQPGAPSLQHEVTSCQWQITVGGLDPAELAERAAAVLAARELVVTRHRKGQDVTDDIRPAILSLAARGSELDCELATQPRGLRPSELLEALGVGLDHCSVLRTHQWMQRDGARLEPLPLPPAATAAPHAEARAS